MVAPLKTGAERAIYFGDLLTVYHVLIATDPTISWSCSGRSKMAFAWAWLSNLVPGKLIPATEELVHR